jgi:multidrug efflux system membrane fusion protein
MIQPASRPSRRRLAAAGLLFVAAGIGWLLLRPAATAPAPSAPAPVLATLAPVLREDVAQEIAGVGTVQADASVTVKTRVDGQLESVGFSEGQDVKAGQLLAQLDPAPLHAQLEQAQAQQARDAAQLGNARLDLQRFEELMRSGSTTQQTLDTQRALVAQLQAAVQTDAAQVDYARVQLDYATIRAPIAGRVGARLVDPGNIVHAADPGGLVVINRIDPIDVVFSVPGDDVATIEAALQGGARLPVSAWARDDRTALGRGELVLVNNQIDPASGTIELKARFANPRHLLWPGQYVNARLQLRLLRGVATVPAAAVLRDQDGTYVFVVGPDARAQQRRVGVLQILRDQAVIGSGVRPGERVVVDGQYKIRPGVAVSAASAPQP